MTIHESIQECMRAGGSECSESRSAIPGRDDQCRWICDPARHAQPCCGCTILASCSSALCASLRQASAARSATSATTRPLHMQMPSDGVPASRRSPHHTECCRRIRNPSLTQAIASGGSDTARHRTAIDAGRIENPTRAEGSGSALRRLTPLQQGGRSLSSTRLTQASMCWSVPVAASQHIAQTCAERSRRAGSPQTSQVGR